jgi:hypothetical protein
MVIGADIYLHALIVMLSAARIITGELAPASDILAVCETNVPHASLGKLAAWTTNTEDAGIDIEEKKEYSAGAAVLTPRIPPKEWTRVWPTPIISAGKSLPPDNTGTKFVSLAPKSDLPA